MHDTQGRAAIKPFVVERDNPGLILERLEHFNGSQTEAAASLHVPLSTLNQKIKRLDIKIPKRSE